MPVASADHLWDLTPFFPNVDSDEYREAVSLLERKLKETQAYWDHEGITAGGQPSSSILVQALESLNELADRSRLINSYLECLVTTDSKSEPAAAGLSEFDAMIVRLQKLNTRFSLWVAGLDLESIAAGSETVRSHAFLLKHAQQRAKHLMDPRLESLASDLSVSGSTGWSRLHSNLTSQIEVIVDGEKLPMPAVRNLAFDADRGKRQRAHEAEIAAWKANELPIAAALNGIKGEVTTLCQSRGWDSPLDEAIFHANIDREALDAMMDAAKDSFPMFRRYMDAKAKALGIPKLAFYDIFAPVGEGSKSWEYGEACDFVVENFGSYSAKLGDFAKRVFRENWVDAMPRNGKVGGAYCQTMRGDECRILMNFDPSYGAVSTLAP